MTSLPGPPVSTSWLKPPSMPVVAGAAVDRLAARAGAQVVGAAATLDRRRLAVGRGEDLDASGAVVADDGRRDGQLQHVEVADVVALAGPAVVGHAVDA